MQSTALDAGTDLWVSWNNYHRSIVKLAHIVYGSGWRFDQVLCLARGDCGREIFSPGFSMFLWLLDIEKYITMAKGTLADRALVVDDLVDSGVALEWVPRHLRQNLPSVTEVKSAVIRCQACFSVRPDFYLDYLETNPWIPQPFDEYDGLLPNYLPGQRKASESVGKVSCDHIFQVQIQ